MPTKVAKKKASKKSTKKSNAKKNKDDDEDESKSGGVTTKVGGDSFEYETLPDDEFMPATLVSYKTKQRPNSFRDDEMQTRITLTFELDDYMFEDADGETGPRRVWWSGTCSLHPKAHLYPVIEGLGFDLEDLDGGEFSFDEIIGLRCRVRVDEKDGDKNQFVAQVKQPKDDDKGAAKGTKNSPQASKTGAKKSTKKAGAKKTAGKKGPSLEKVKEFATAWGIEHDDEADLDAMKEAIGESAAGMSEAEGFEESDAKMLEALGLSSEPAEDDSAEKEAAAFEKLKEIATKYGVEPKKGQKAPALVKAMKAAADDWDTCPEDELGALKFFGLVEGEGGGDAPDMSFLD